MAGNRSESNQPRRIREDEKEKEEVEKAWQKEVRRRMSEIDRGLEIPVPWDEVKKKLEKNQNAGKIS